MVASERGGAALGAMLLPKLRVSANERLPRLQTGHGRQASVRSSKLRLCSFEKSLTESKEGAPDKVPGPFAVCSVKTALPSSCVRLECDEDRVIARHFSV